MPNIGELGEKLVAQWLQAQGWTILQHRWRCRWGELDLIARQYPVAPHLPPIQALLDFVEVKTHSQGNWDADGLLSITLQKQAKILHLAQLFLARHPDLADLPCRFDVALVRCQKVSPKSPQKYSHSHSLESYRFASPITQTDFSSSSLKKGQTQGKTFTSVREEEGYQFFLQDYIQSAFD
ncbi:MAG: hypothetical protein NVS2B14_19750 [Chamaesiphon sp.]